jgi:hypothetical protein
MGPITVTYSGSWGIDPDFLSKTNDLISKNEARKPTQPQFTAIQS